MTDHPNKIEFLGVLAVLDEPSQKPPTGARGHCVVLSKKAAENALFSIIGMGINISEGSIAHNSRAKIGIITDATVTGKELFVSGYLFKKDVPDIVATLQASSAHGMSCEIHDAYIDDQCSENWIINKCTFTGAAIVLKERAAYKFTDFLVL